MWYWIIIGGILVIVIAVYTVVFIFARKRQKAFDAQYLAMKERHEVFVLNKRRLRERGQSGVTKYVPFRTYQVVGRVTVGQTMKGVHMNRVQNVTFRTTKEEYDKIQINHKYRMDIMGNYIGNVVSEVQSKRAQQAQRNAKSKAQSAEDKPKRRFLRRGGNS
ncbi:hypothetical protein NZD89_21685 [Alicyclobacillus fastidiosus]|uniref:Uncharacterized protein n=1 Tax=Alicyclobacillus fastidiosus TaxID=392011 RepID=A0ABY6ZDF4_9BACL|nr:hypothetical protein [Alicyclobacillus fastidiosus]WAH40876.1 hypothetical protein NZD89_21685 [Alicyclobacillus fastidiosus]